MSNLLLFLVSSFTVTAATMKTTNNCWKQRDCNFFMFDKISAIWYAAVKTSIRVFDIVIR